MPISASAKKSLRVSLRRAGENKTMKLRLKNQLKKTSGETLADSYRLIDKAAKNHIIHKNKAARLKSRLVKKLVQTPTIATTVKRKAKKTTKTK